MVKTTRANPLYVPVTLRLLITPSIDRKSSQGYIMTLFGGAIGWRANKQNTVTTSSTEAELLALSQTAKEAIFMSRLFKALSLELSEPLRIKPCGFSMSQ